MRAAVVGEGPDHAVTWGEAFPPGMKPDEVRIRVRAAGLNRADLVQRMGLYPPPPGASPILGLEAAGEVVAVGQWVKNLSVGDRVTTLLTGGGCAEEVCAPALHSFSVPDGMSYTDAAALPEVLCTAWLNLIWLGKLGPNDRVLLHAGASGVGTAAIQVARRHGARVWVTVGSADKLARCIELGAEGGCDRHEQRFGELAKGWTEGEGFDVVIDPVGGGYLEDNMRHMAVGGRLVVIGLMGGRYGKLDVGRLLMKRIELLGSTLRSRHRDYKTALVQSMRTLLWPAVESGEVRPIVHRVFAASDIAEAHALLESNTTVGKVVLEM